MKAVTLVKHGNPKDAFEIREHDDPKMKKGDVLIKVEGFGLNYADVMARNGLYREAPPTPCILGYEVVGVVIEAADDAGKDLVGKRVLAFTRFGGYAELVRTPAIACAVVGDMPIGEATALGTQGATAYYSSQYITNMNKGEKVFIHAAAGGVGSLLVQMAKANGCEVFGTASKPEKLEFLKSIGCDHPINYRKNDYVEEAKKILKDDRIDVMFNPIGGSTYKKDKKILGSNGRHVLYGGSERSDGKWGFLSTLAFVWRMGLNIPIFLMMKSQSIMGVNMLKIGDNKPHVFQHCIEEVIKLQQQGVIKPHVGGEFKVENVAEAHAKLENRDSMGKFVVKW